MAEKIITHGTTVKVHKDDQNNDQNITITHTGTAGRITSATGTIEFDDPNLTSPISLSDSVNTELHPGFVAGSLLGCLNEVKDKQGSRKTAVIDIATSTSAPPTESTGDRYILDTSGAPHADWDGATQNDIVEFNGTSWIAETPSEGWVAYVDAQNSDARFIDDGSPQWEIGYTSAHAIGSSTHTSSTLTELNALVSDGNLDFDSAERYPSDHASDHESGGTDKLTHDNIEGSGVYSHAQIDAHIDDSTIHFTEASIDHGSISGLGDDDHTHYTKADGTRAFTGNVSGVTPTADSHLTRKDYVDDLTPKAVSSIAELRTTEPSNTSTASSIVLASSAVLGDGGDAIFYWVPTSTETDDGVLYVKVDTITTGRWHRFIDNGYVNVRWFGATGDGVTDDASAIQSAIEKAADFAETTGGQVIVYFPNGRYYIDDARITLKTSLSNPVSNIILRGAGAGSRLEFDFNTTPSDGSGIAIAASDAENLIIEDLHISGSSGKGFHRGILIERGKYITIQRTEIEGAGLDSSLSYTSGIVLQGNVQNADIINNLVHDIGLANTISYSIVCYPVSNVGPTSCLILGNTVISEAGETNKSNFGIIAFDSTKLNITKNYVEGFVMPYDSSPGGYGIAVYQQAGGTSNNHIIEGNHVIDTEGTGIYVQSSAGTVVTGNVIDTVAKVQDAGTLVVGGIAINEGPATVRNNVIKNVAIGSSAPNEPVGIGIQSQANGGCAAVGNAITNTQGAGIQLRGECNNTSVSNNTITDWKNDGGIVGVGLSGNNITNASIVGNTLVRTDSPTDNGPGVNLTYTIDSVIASNIIKRPGGQGILALTGCERINVVNNIVWDAGQSSPGGFNSIDLRGTGYHYVSDNISGSDETPKTNTYGLRVSGTDNTVMHNYLNGASGDFSDAGTSTITEDTVISANPDVSNSVAHISGTGADHSYIDQSVTTAATPSFTGATLTSALNLNTGVSSHSIINAKYVGTGGGPLFGLYNNKTTGIVTNDVLGQYRFYGNDTVADDIYAASLVAQASQDWSGSAHGTSYLFYITKNDETTPSAALSLNGNGNAYFYANVWPNADATFELGYSTRRWTTVYTADLNASGNITNSSGTLTINPTTYTRIGDAGTSSHSLSADGLFCSGDFECDGSAYFDSLCKMYGGFWFEASAAWYGGIYNGVDDGTRFMIGDSDGYGNNHLIFTAGTNYNKDHDHDTLSTNPTIFIHSDTDPDTDNTQWLSVCHDQTNAIFETGKGGYYHKFTDGSQTETSTQGMLSLALSASGGTQAITLTGTGFGLITATRTDNETHGYAFFTYRQSTDSSTLIINLLNSNDYVAITDVASKVCLLGTNETLTVKNNISGAITGAIWLFGGDAPLAAAS